MTSEAQMIREGGTQVAWKLNPCKPPASLRSAISLQFRGLSWHGQGQLAVEEMACYSHGVSFHWILKYSWLKPLVLSLPLHLSVCFSSFSVHLPLFCFSCLPAFFSSIHFCLSLVSFLPQPESKRRSHSILPPLLYTLSGQRESSLLLSWVASFSRKHHGSIKHSHCPCAFAQQSDPEILTSRCLFPGICCLHSSLTNTAMLFTLPGLAV